MSAVGREGKRFRTPLAPPGGPREPSRGLSSPRDGRAPTIGLALIVRDEAELLPGLLASIRGAFDQLVAVDTGSVDWTRQLVWTFLALDGAEGRVIEMPWPGRFDLPRNRADELLSTDWIVTADADDRIEGAGLLRGVGAEAAAADLDGVVFEQEIVGLGTIHRAQMVRRGIPWRGWVHERRRPKQTAIASGVRWVNRGDGRHGSSEPRDREIARRWAAAEPRNPDAQAVAAFEELKAGSLPGAVGFVRRLSDLRPPRGDEQANAIAILEAAAGGDERNLAAFADVRSIDRDGALVLLGARAVGDRRP